MRRATLVVGTIVATLACSQAAGAWSLVQVGPGGRSLEIRQGKGACESNTLRVVQSQSAVAITIIAKPFGGEGACPAILFINTYTIHLSRSLAGRHVQGGDRTVASAGPKGGPEASRYQAVPRLTGLAPDDARFLLGGLQLHTVLHVVGETRGLPRVVSQSPAPGVRVPKNRVVRVNVLR